MKRLFALLPLIFSPAFAGAKNAPPPEPYMNQGFCPFEGCSYQEWTVTEKTAFHSAMDANSPVIFSADKGEKVEGLTGTVITRTIGQAKAKKAAKLGPDDQLHVKPGDTIYLLGNVGEGSYLIWNNGDKLIGQLEEPAQQITREPKTEWWVQVKNKKGQTGWTIAKGNFDNMNSFESP